MSVFLTKKQKAQMRERRRKKKVVQTENEQEGSPSLQKEVTTSSSSSSSETVVPANGSETNKKRSREDSLDVEVGGSGTATATDPTTTIPSLNPNKRRKQDLDLRTKMIDGKLHVVIPNEIATKDAKKFRKDARRQLREGGGTVETEIVFVDEDDLPPSFRASKKKQFPSIKELLQERQQQQQLQNDEEKKKEKIQQIPDEIKAQYVALDCEMVGIGSGGKKSALARVSIVDWDLNVILDTFVKVPIRVTDFRTHVSGVEAKNIKDKNAMGVEECRNTVAAILKDKILVGHALTNDFKALMLSHPKMKIRDTTKYRPFQRYGNGKWRPRKLRDLVSENLKGKDGFQQGEHDSVEDARSTMELFQLVRIQWEKELSSSHKR